MGVIASNVLVFVSLLVLVEVGFRSVIEGYSDDRTFRLTRPPPYDDAPYFSPEFVAESFAQPGGWRTLPGLNAIVPIDFRGEYFTVTNGIRHTTDVLRDAGATIYLFGGSTVYGSEVPDGYTIASYLQRKLVHAGFSDYRVVNLGVTSVSTNQQLERLAATPLAERDIVVFYDGVNDVMQGVLYGNAGHTIVGNDRARPFGHKLLYRLSKKSVAMRYVLTRTNANYRIANLEERVAATVERYSANLAQAEKLTRDKGVKFVHFLQPTLYSLARRGEYENALLTYGFVPAQAEAAFVAAYPHLEKIVEVRADHGFADFNLTTAFDDLADPVYLDGWHVTHRGNEVVARHIFAGLVTANVIHCSPTSGMELAGNTACKEAPYGCTRDVESRPHARRNQSAGQDVLGSARLEGSLSPVARGRPCTGKAADGGSGDRATGSVD